MEKRKFERKPIIAEGILTSSINNKTISVWVKDYSSDGMRVTFYKSLFCNRCEFFTLEDFHMCEKRENCEIYNLEKTLTILSKGEISLDLEGEKVQRKYEMKWCRIFYDRDIVDFGIKFLS